MHRWARGRPSGGGSGIFFPGGEWFLGPPGGGGERVGLNGGERGGNF